MSTRVNSGDLFSFSLFVGAVQHLYLILGEELPPRPVQRPVRDDIVQLVDAADGNEAGFAEFGVVRQQIHAVRVLHDGLADVGDGLIGVVDAPQGVDGPAGQKGLVHTVLLEVAHRLQAGKALNAAVVGAAGAHQLDIEAVGQLADDPVGVGDHRQGHLADLVAQGQGRGGVVDKNAVVGADLLRRPAADGLFLIHEQLAFHGVGHKRRLPVLHHGAAVGPLEESLLLQGLEVPANGLAADLEPPRHVQNGGALVLQHVFFQFFSSLRCHHISLLPLLPA